MDNLDAVSRWLYAGRFLILVISVQAAILAALVALPSGKINLWFFLPLLLGFVVLHALSNFSNDYFGYARGHDTPDSPRVTYTIHPLAHGVLTKRALVTGLGILWAVALLVAAFFFWQRGWPALVLSIAGALLLYLYDAAPTSLKAMGLGEFASFLVWGPLMVGGGYFCLTGDFSWSAVAVGTPYGLGIAAILVGKHIDQAAFDAGKHIRTLPVLLGEPRSRFLNQTLVVGMYLLVALAVFFRLMTPWALLVFLNLPSAWRVLKTCASPRPNEAPAGWVGWPLWLHRFNLVHNRRFGWLYLLGFACQAVWSLWG
jgi:1,4-dihydroxy-2-naphthoate octaprenyltransferase